MPLGKRSEFGDARYAGVDISYAHNIAEHMQVRPLPCAHSTPVIATAAVVTRSCFALLTHFPLLLSGCLVNVYTRRSICCADLILWWLLWLIQPTSSLLCLAMLLLAHQQSSQPSSGLS